MRILWLAGWFLVGFFAVQIFFMHSVRAVEFEPDGWHVGTIIGSDHWSDPYNKDEPYNEDHWPSLYAGWSFDNKHTHTFGFYENSYKDTTVFYHYGQRYNEHVEVLAGVAAGYDDWPVLPFLAVKFHVGPVWGGVFPGVNAYGLEHRWDE